MQTFVPFMDNKRTAKVLDDKRLMKQLVEAKQILIAHKKQQENEEAPGTHEKVGWANHPATKMWTGYLPALAHYMDTMLRECARRKFKIITGKYLPIYKWAMGSENPIAPPWWGGPIHWTHQCNLCHKDWDYYGGMFPSVTVEDAFPPTGEPKPEYFWPTNLSKIQAKWDPSQIDFEELLKNGPGGLIQTNPSTIQSPQTGRFSAVQQMEDLHRLHEQMKQIKEAEHANKARSDLEEFIEAEMRRTIMERKP